MKILLETPRNDSTYNNIICTKTKILLNHIAFLEPFLAKTILRLIIDFYNSAYSTLVAKIKKNHHPPIKKNCPSFVRINTHFTQEYFSEEFILHKKINVFLLFRYYLVFEALLLALQ